jgi:glyoxylase-like metal-dependent hydrolase (beta-lactamase superfamily II)
VDDAAAQGNFDSGRTIVDVQLGEDALDVNLDGSNNVLFLPAEIVSHDFCRQTLVASVGNPKPDYWKPREGWADGTEDFRVVPPAVSFSGNTTCRYGDLVVECLFSGPAHTWGDVIVHLPQRRIVFAGDIAFHSVMPTAWQGHVSKWVEAADRILAMDVEIIVPGLGPLGGQKELAEMRGYLAILKREVNLRYDAHLRPGQAAADIDMAKFEGWLNPERIVANTLRLYAEFDGTLTPVNDREGTRKATEEYNVLRPTHG